MRKLHACLLAVFIVAFSIRIMPYFWEDRSIGLDSYYHTRMAGSFQDGMPVYDELSYGGRPYVYPPGIHLLLMPYPQAAPFIITLIGSLLILSVFLLARQIYGDKAGLLAAFLIAFIPVHIWKSSSNVLVTAIDLTLLTLAAYFLAKKKFPAYLSVSALIFIFSPAVSMLSLLLFASCAKKNNKTMIIATLIIAEAIAAYHLYGSALSIYTSALPWDISSALYENIGIADMFYRLTPFLIPLSVYGLWLSRNRMNKMLLLWLFVVLVLFAAGKIETDRGLVYMAVPLCILSGQAISTFKRKEIVTSILIVTTITGIYSINNLRWGIVTDDEYSALTWIKGNTPPDSVVLAQFLEGHWVSGIAERKNVADPNLIGAPAAERLADILSAYRNESQKEILQKYNVSYVLYTERAPQVDSQLEYFPYKEVYRSGEIRVFEVSAD